MEFDTINLTSSGAQSKSNGLMATFKGGISIYDCISWFS